MFKSKKTVDSILSAFSTTIAELKQVALTSADTIVTEEAIIADSKDRIAAAKAEKDRAEAVAKKLEAVIGN